MTVKKLIEELSKRNPEAIVVKSGDEEGNSFYEVEQLEINCAIRNPGENNLDMGVLELTEDLIERGFDEDDVAEGPEAVVLW